MQFEAIPALRGHIYTSMFTESANNAARYMRVTALFVFSQALLLIGEGSWMMLNHKSHVPHYHNHHVHDACHSLAYVLGALLGFYTLIIFLIVLTKEARSEQWAIRLLGLPNLIFIVFTAIILAWLALQYEEHDEHWFVFALDLGCGGGLLFIVYFLLSFSSNALAQLKSYAKVWVFVLGIPICGIALIFFYENLPIHEYIGLATIVPYLATLLTTQRGKITKALKSL